MNTVQIILLVPALSETTKLGLRQIYPSQTLHKENYEHGIFDLVKKLHSANLTPDSFGGPNHCSVVIPELGAAMKVIPLPISNIVGLLIRYYSSSIDGSLQSISGQFTLT